MRSIFTVMTGPNWGTLSTMGRRETLANEMEHPHQAHALQRSKTTALDVAGGELISSWCFPSSSAEEALFRYDDRTIVTTESNANGDLTVIVVADGVDAQGHALEVLAAVMAGVEPLDPQPAGTARIRFWYGTEHGPNSTIRSVDVPAWESIEANYAAAARAELAEVMALDGPPVDGGKILLLHGPAGTGKTTAIRAIADSWRAWCDVEYVTDPERAFGEASYLVTMMLTGQEGGDDRWRLLVIEDAGAFLCPEEHEIDQSIARLFNLTDGLIGQGLRLLVLLSTNEELHKLHPALTRPGRCLAHVEVPTMSPTEAAVWLGEKEATEATLAQLFEVRARSQIGIGLAETRMPGQYL